MEHAGEKLNLEKCLMGAATGGLIRYLPDERGAPRRSASGARLGELGRQTGDVIERRVHGHADQAVHSPSAMAGAAPSAQQGSVRHPPAAPQAASKKAAGTDVAGTGPGQFHVARASGHAHASRGTALSAGMRAGPVHPARFRDTAARAALLIGGGHGRRPPLH